MVHSVSTKTLLMPYGFILCALVSLPSYHSKNYTFETKYRKRKLTNSVRGDDHMCAISPRLCNSITRTATIQNNDVLFYNAVIWLFIKSFHSFSSSFLRIGREPCTRATGAFYHGKRRKVSPLNATLR